jgi:hypothetical protein
MRGGKDDTLLSLVQRGPEQRHQAAAQHLLHRVLHNTGVHHSCIFFQTKNYRYNSPFLSLFCNTVLACKKKNYIFQTAWQRASKSKILPFSQLFPFSAKI